MLGLESLLGLDRSLEPCVAYGTMGLGGRYDRDDGKDDQALALLDHALRRNVVLMDTAEVYGAGYGEELIGQALAARPGAATLIASKFSPEHAGAKELVAAAKASLRRLRRERIDLYQMHWGNPSVPVSETLEALARLVKEGCVRAVGFGNVSPKELQALMYKVPAGLPVVSVQQEYSLTERFAERRLLPLCRAMGLALIAYSPLGQGGLAQAKDGALAEVAKRNGLTPAQAALQWLARQGGVLPIPMSSKLENLEANLACLDTRLPDADMQRLSLAFAPDDVLIDTAAIDVAASHSGRVYKSLEEALTNPLGFSPSPVDLAQDIDEDSFLKPVKLRAHPEKTGRYLLFEGQLRYWAWVIAHRHHKPIPAKVIGDVKPWESNSR